MKPRRPRRGFFTSAATLGMPCTSKTTPLTDGKPAPADQVNELVWFFSSGISTHLTGTDVFIDGGESPLQS